MTSTLPFAAAFSSLLLAAALAAQTPAVPAPAAQAPAAPRPDQSPVVAVGSRIAWNVPYVATGTVANLQVLDVYAPAEAKNAPVVVFVHGGEWLKGDKREVSFKPKFLNENGIVFVSVNYRLSGTNRHPAQVDDVAAALRWTRDHIGEHGGDPKQVFLLGHSAGTHLVTLVALDPRILARVQMTPTDLAGVISWSGSNFDLLETRKESEEKAQQVEQCFGKDEAGLRLASPMAHVTDGKALPRFLFASVGVATKPTARERSEKMVGLIRAAGGKAEAVVLQDKTHFQANHELGMKDGGEALGAVLLAFVRGK